jgi:hypothetical protein
MIELTPTLERFAEQRALRFAVSHLTQAIESLDTSAELCQRAGRIGWASNLTREAKHLRATRDTIEANRAR